MNAKINEGCIGCGMCETACPEVFRVGDQGVAEVVGEVTPANESSAREAAEGCPVSVILIEG